MNMLHKLKSDKAYRLRLMVQISLTFNIVYAMGNFLLGLINASVWFVTVGIYFLVLSITRIGCFYMLRREEKQNTGVLTFAGAMLIVLCLSLSGSIILSNRLDVVRPVHQIVMLAIATYTTVKTTLAILNAVKAHKARSNILIALRNIGCADVAVSILSMQRSMLVSFGEMALPTVKLMNILTGVGASLIILAFAVSMLLAAGKEHMNS